MADRSALFEILRTEGMDKANAERARRNRGPAPRHSLRHVRRVLERRRGHRLHEALTANERTLLVIPSGF